MTNDNESTNVTNRSGGVDLNAEGDANVGGDVVGRDKTESAGGHIIHAGPGAVVTITESASPPNPKLLSVSEQIRDRANAALRENQHILFPVIKDPTTRYMVAGNLARLYHEQQSRGDFGEWLAYLETARSKESDPDIRTIIEELLSAASQLHYAFYAHPESRNAEITAITKRQLLSVLLRSPEGLNLWNHLSDQQVVELVEEYLDFLRTRVEEAGRAVGKLSVLLS